MRKIVLIFVSLLLVVSFTLAACQSSVTPLSAEQAPRENIESPTIAATKKPTTAPTDTLPTEIVEPELAIGSTRIRSKDGMEQVYVPAGEFIMGSDDSYANSDEQPVRSVYLDSYWIDNYEITNGKFEDCVSAGYCTSPSKNESFNRSSYYGNSSYDNFPVITINWHQAKAYCEWAGGDLPTEAQWEKAARGTDGRKYPWGNQEPDNSYANYNNNIEDTTEVGFYVKGASPYGAMDMAGIVWEWVNDWFGSYDVNDTNNPMGENSGRVKAIRGACWDGGSSDIRSACRGSFDPDYWNYSIGFRCVSMP